MVSTEMTPKVWASVGESVGTGVGANVGAGDVNFRTTVFEFDPDEIEFTVAAWSAVTFMLMPLSMAASLAADSNGEVPVASGVNAAVTWESRALELSDAEVGPGLEIVAVTP